MIEVTNLDLRTEDDCPAVNLVGIILLYCTFIVYKKYNTVIVSTKTTSKNTNYSLVRCNVFKYIFFVNSQCDSGERTSDYI